MAATPTQGAETVAMGLEEINRRADRQSANLQQLDLKAGLLAGFAATAAQFLANHKGLGPLGVVGASLYAAAFFAAVASMFVRSFADAPSPEALSNLGSNAKTASAEMLGNKLNAFARVRRVQAVKALWWTLSASTVAVAVVVSAIALARGGHS